MEKTNLYLTKRQLEELRKLSQDDGLPMAEHIRRAVDDYLAKLSQEQKGG